jgi:hypothetical protein
MRLNATGVIGVADFSEPDGWCPVSRTNSAKKAGATSQVPRRKRTLPQGIAQTTPATISAFAVGDRVAHPQFGDGTITAIEGPKLSITFDTEGNKQIIDSYVKRQKK